MIRANLIVVSLLTFALPLLANSKTDCIYKTKNNRDGTLFTEKPISETSACARLSHGLSIVKQDHKVYLPRNNGTKDKTKRRRKAKKQVRVPIVQACGKKIYSCAQIKKLRKKNLNTQRQKSTQGLRDCRRELSIAYFKNCR